eukprot:Gb_38787 [translate_table: standard]
MHLICGIIIWCCPRTPVISDLQAVDPVVISVADLEALQRHRLGLQSAAEIQKHNSGLSAGEIESLPYVTCKAKLDGEAEECSICLFPMEENQLIRFLPQCTHSFHKDCIDCWLSQKGTCPLCYTQVVSYAIHPQGPPHTHD